MALRKARGWRWWECGNGDKTNHMPIILGIWGMKQKKIEVEEILDWKSWCDIDIVDRYVL
jgi:hypothetical protein